MHIRPIRYINDNDYDYHKDHLSHQVFFVKTVAGSILPPGAAPVRLSSFDNAP
ncbi:hypothetical protein SEHO0A_04391 [Salmonella enterica subsp. houtenae str. ATCC BAA-1581]|nr:hypothetical protein SEHO0A_04391 [Salmonella enterica subsp. houtenae str. ATCC BAA-1581]